MKLSRSQQQWLAEVEAELERIVDRLRRLDPERVVLFGSYARGDFNECSDIDLAVIWETDRPYLDRIGEALRVMEARRAVEVVVYTPQEWRELSERGSAFAEQIATQGRVLYERSEPD